MDDVLEYMRRLYEVQFSDFHKWECPQFLDGKICICIHSIAMSYFLYMADCCYYLDKNIRCNITWNTEYGTYFLKGICDGQNFVKLIRQQGSECECYLKKELCKNEQLPFHYVAVRLIEKEDIATEYLLEKMDKDSDSRNILDFFCKVAKIFRKRTDKEYADLLLRTALFLFPHSTWKFLEKSKPVFAEKKEKIDYIKYNLNLLQEYMDISENPPSADRIQIINTLEKYLGIPIWKIWREYESKYTIDLLEPVLRDKIDLSRAQSMRFSKFIDRLESSLDPQDRNGVFKEKINECRERVNNLKNGKIKKASIC